MKSLPLHFVASILFPYCAFAAPLQGVKVAGEKAADITFQFQGATDAPTMQIDENAVVLSFANSTLVEALQGKVDLVSPHTLVQRISAFASERGNVNARVVINGSTENLKQRLHLTREGNTARLLVDYPSGASAATIKLLEQEQAPLVDPATLKKPTDASATPSILKIILAIVIFGAAGGGTYAATKFLKKKGSWRGSRKYLIETLSYVSVGSGTKTGVGLIKVGNEFVLVGIAPGQVTYLSSLPKLAEQFEQENRFERENFQEAVQDEVRRMKNTPVKKAGMSV